jgi:hypothetical protein
LLVFFSILLVHRDSLPESSSVVQPPFSPLIPAFSRRSSAGPNTESAWASPVRICSTIRGVLERGFWYNFESRSQTVEVCLRAFAGPMIEFNRRWSRFHCNDREHRGTCPRAGSAGTETAISGATAGYHCAIDLGH